MYDELLINSKRLKGILSFPLPKTKTKQLRAFLGLTGYCHNWIPRFSLMAQPLYALSKSDRPYPIRLNPEGKQAEKT